MPHEVVHGLLRRRLLGVALVFDGRAEACVDNVGGNFDLVEGGHATNEPDASGRCAGDSVAPAFRSGSRANDSLDEVGDCAGHDDDDGDEELRNPSDEVIEELLECINTEGFDSHLDDDEHDQPVDEFGQEHCRVGITSSFQWTAETALVDERVDVGPLKDVLHQFEDKLGNKPANEEDERLVRMKSREELQISLRRASDTGTNLSVVKINALEVPAQAGEEIVKRFAARMGSLHDVAGFEGFELLAPDR
ncbi:Heme-degrading monooxygenase HmoB [Nymphon striatum]|nr:Heme-degrading monooxygenase HmoB [Nymphon striatum]